MVRARSGRKPADAASVASREAPAAAISAEERERMIARAAYFRAEKRGFAPGRELEDWLAAEAEVDAALGLRPAQG
ncbi:MAG: DUF2934 domain-containing protein [Burkholderiales bacterium]|nr:DUF2934 domain-containing protein [Burkholderiales bacterium]